MAHNFLAKLEKESHLPTGTVRLSHLQSASGERYVIRSHQIQQQSWPLSRPRGNIVATSRSNGLMVEFLYLWNYFSYYRTISLINCIPFLLLFPGSSIPHLAQPASPLAFHHFFFHSLSHPMPCQHAISPLFLSSSSSIDSALCSGTCLHMP